MEKEKIFSILDCIINFKYDINKLKKMANILPWDSDSDIYVVNRNLLKSILEKFLIENIDFHEIEEWANLIECREDIGYTEPLLQEIIHELISKIDQL